VSSGTLIRHQISVQGVPQCQSLATHKVPAWTHSATRPPRGLT
jgi:hypothetical protein